MGAVLEADALGVESGQVFVGGQFRVEDQLLGQTTASLPPELEEAEDFVVLLVLAQLGVGVTEDPPVVVLGEEGEDSLLAPAALGDVVFFGSSTFQVDSGIDEQRQGTDRP